MREWRTNLKFWTGGHAISIASVNPGGVHFPGVFVIFLKAGNFSQSEIALFMVS